MVSALKVLGVELEGAVAGLSAEATRMGPPGVNGKWSIQQIVEHLLMSYRATLDVIGKRVEKGRATETRASAQQRVLQTVVIGMGYFPPGRSAPNAVFPSDTLPVEDGRELGARVRDLLAALQRETERAEAMFGKRRSATHLILGPLSMGQWRKFHLVHGRHHIKQIRAIRRARGV